MTKAELLKLLDPYAPDEQVVFVTFQEGIFVHAEAEISKGHGTTVTAPDGTVSMPVAIYLVDEGQRGKGRVMGMDSKDILPGGWPEPSPDPGGGAMQVPGVQRLLISLLELGRTIAADTDDPMYGVLASARDIDSAAPEMDAVVLITTTDGRRFSIAIADAE